MRFCVCIMHLWIDESIDPYIYIYICIYIYNTYCWPRNAAVATPTATMSLFKALIESWSPVSAVYGTCSFAKIANAVPFQAVTLAAVLVRRLNQAWPCFVELIV